MVLAIGVGVLILIGIVAAVFVIKDGSSPQSRDDVLDTQRSIDYMNNPIVDELKKQARFKD